MDMCYVWNIKTWKENCHPLLLSRNSYPSFEAQLLVSQSPCSCYPPPVFLFFLFIFCLMFINLWRRKTIYYNQDKCMTFHIQFFLSVSIGTWMHLFIYLFVFNCIPHLPLNYSLQQPLVHLSLFYCSSVMISTPEANKRPCFTNLLINSSEITNVHPIHNNRVLSQNPRKLISKRVCAITPLLHVSVFFWGG